MIITVNIVIILTLGCFIVGMIMGIRLMRPLYYGGNRGRLSSGMRRYDD